MKSWLHWGMESIEQGQEETGNVKILLTQSGILGSEGTWDQTPNSVDEKAESRARERPPDGTADNRAQPSHELSWSPDVWF